MQMGMWVIFWVSDSGKARGSSWGLNALPHDSAALRANKYKQA